MKIIVVQTATFQRQIKKLYKNQKQDLDTAIYEILKNTNIGEMKKGDLAGVQVHKFFMINQLTLLAYEFFENQLQLHLLMLGSHENFYRDLKR
ncbi:MAG: type II toxin-antitoxin system RelE/ParE family toxin [Candidatus Chromulinivorax sp.]|nr:type II toxin-antitoxin system RelE/ParE family toxin [Candidatus Chromulinivorax sp.]